MAMYAAVAGQALQMAGTLSAGLNQAQGYNQAANAADTNADISRQNAQQARDAGLQNELRERRQNAQALGEQRAAFAESGLDPSSGSALDVQRQSTGNAELNALQQRYEGLLRGTAYDNQANIAHYQAKGLRQQGKAARSAAYLTLLGKGLSAYGSFAGGAGGAAAGSGGGFMDAGTSAGGMSNIG